MRLMYIFITAATIIPCNKRRSSLLLPLASIVHHLNRHYGTGVRLRQKKREKEYKKKDKESKKKEMRNEEWEGKMNKWGGQHKDKKKVRMEEEEAENGKEINIKER
jgi:hypothetical protein